MRFILLCCLIFLSGCVVLPERDERGRVNETSLEAQAILKFSDIPVPVGFKLVSQGSYSFEAQGVRVGLLKYQGKGDVEKVVNFYKEQMPMYNWNMLNAIEFGERLLNFDRETETCIVSLSAKGRSISIFVSLGPKSETTRKFSRPVK